MYHATVMNPLLYYSKQSSTTLTRTPRTAMLYPHASFMQAITSAFLHTHTRTMVYCWKLGERLTLCLQIDFQHIVAIIVHHCAIVFAVMIRLTVTDDQGRFDATRHRIHQYRVVVSVFSADFMSIKCPRDVTRTWHRCCGTFKARRITHPTELIWRRVNGGRTFQVNIRIGADFFVAGHIGFAIVATSCFIANGKAEIGVDANDLEVEERIADSSYKFFYINNIACCGV